METSDLALIAPDGNAALREQRKVCRSKEFGTTVGDIFVIFSVWVRGPEAMADDLKNPGADSCCHYVNSVA